MPIFMYIYIYHIYIIYISYIYISYIYIYIPNMFIVSLNISLWGDYTVILTLTRSRSLSQVFFKPSHLLSRTNHRGFPAGIGPFKKRALQVTSHKRLPKQCFQDVSSMISASYFQVSHCSIYDLGLLYTQMPEVCVQSWAKNG